MSRTCTICTHPQRASIEAAIASGTPLRNIAKHYDVGFSSVNRHAIDHISSAIQETQVAKNEAQSLDVIKQLKVINNITLAILQEARTGKMHALALSAIDRVQKQIELQAKLVGAIDKQQEQEAQEGFVIPYNHISARARMEIRRALVEDEQRKERTG